MTLALIPPRFEVRGPRPEWNIGAHCRTRRADRSDAQMAIISSSKRFIRSPSCQKVIEGIWSGRIIYSALNAHALIADVSEDNSCCHIGAWGRHHSFASYSLTPSVPHSLTPLRPHTPTPPHPHALALPYFHASTLKLLCRSPETVGGHFDAVD